MKPITDYLNRELTSKRINETEGLDPKTKAELMKKYKEVDNIVKKMNIGRFNYNGCGYRGCQFGIGKRITWGFDLDLFEEGMRFDSVASYGAFRFDEDVYDLYMSIGLVLSQRKELTEIEKIFKEIKQLLREYDDEL